MAKQTRNVRLEIAAELLKLESKLGEGIRATNRSSEDRDALQLIADARNALLSY